MKIITINTDASFSNEYKFWTYAYWIKWDWFFYKGSWVFKQLLKWSTDAEVKAIAVAFWILQEQKHDFDFLIINRDNIFANKTALKNYIKKLKDILKKEYWKRIRKVQFRHIKAHTGDLSTAKSYVNDWCDRSAKEQFYNHKEKILKYN
jgi:hypothetical protein